MPFIRYQKHRIYVCPLRQYVKTCANLNAESCLYRSASLITCLAYVCVTMYTSVCTYSRSEIEVQLGIYNDDV